MDSIGPDRQVFLPCDSCYPEGCVAGLVDENIVYGSVGALEL